MKFSQLWIYTQLAISDLTKCNNQFLTFLSESVAFMYLIVSQIQPRRSLLPCCPREVWGFGDVTAHGRVQLWPWSLRLSLTSFPTFNLMLSLTKWYLNKDFCQISSNLNDYFKILSFVYIAYTNKQSCPPKNACSILVQKVEAGEGKAHLAPPRAVLSLSFSNFHR